jgi:hypothetical protein
VCPRIGIRQGVTSGCPLRPVPFVRPSSAYRASGEPADPGSLNRYVYANGDPANFNDPSGLDGEGPPASGCSVNGFWFPICPSMPVGGQPVQEPPTAWDALSFDCQDALRKSHPARNDAQGIPRWLGMLARAEAAKDILQAAGDATGINWELLAAIGVQESGFSNVHEASGGLGVGVFQIDLGQNPGVSAKQAGNLGWAANWAASTLANSAARIAKALPGVSSDIYLFSWMTAASWNTGWGGQVRRYRNGESPDYHTSPIDPRGTPNRRYKNNYGSVVLGLMDCFR